MRWLVRRRSTSLAFSCTDKISNQKPKKKECFYMIISSTELIIKETTKIEKNTSRSSTTAKFTESVLVLHSTHTCLIEQLRVALRLLSHDKVWQGQRITDYLNIYNTRPQLFSYLVLPFRCLLFLQALYLWSCFEYAQCKKCTNSLKTSKVSRASKTPISARSAIPSYLSLKSCIKENTKYFTHCLKETKMLKISNSYNSFSYSQIWHVCTVFFFTYIECFYQ